MPVLTPKQADALRIANRNDIITTADAHPAVLTSLYKRGFLDSEGWLGSNRCYAPTDAAIEVMEQYDKAIKTVEDFGRRVDNTVAKMTTPDDSGIGGIPDWIAELPAPTPIPAWMEDLPDGIHAIPEPDPSEAEEERIYDQWYKENVPSIPEPDRSEADTEPLEPLKTTFHLYEPSPLTDDGQRYRYERRMQTREQYERAYRYERATAYRHAVQTDDIPVDLMVMAYESYKNAPVPLPEPFILRHWQKQMERALNTLNHVAKTDKWNDRAFDSAVLDYKFAKSRYACWEERIDWSKQV